MQTRFSVEYGLKSKEGVLLRNVSAVPICDYFAVDLRVGLGKYAHLGCDRCTHAAKEIYFQKCHTEPRNNTLSNYPPPPPPFNMAKTFSTPLCVGVNLHMPPPSVL